MIKMAWYDLKASHYILLGIILCWVRPCVAQDERALFDELDHLLSRQKELVAEKERKIKIIKDGLAVPQITPEQSYAINSRLYDEYMAFKYDSAYKYANKICRLPAHWAIGIFTMRVCFTWYISCRSPAFSIKPTDG